METPACVKCGSTASMVEQDSGPTYKSWMCKACGISRTKKNIIGKTIPFLGLGLALFFGLPDGGDCTPPDTSS